MSVGWLSLAVGAAFLTALVAENVRTLRLRDVISLGGLLATLATAAVGASATGEVSALIGCVAGAVGLFALCFIVEFARPSTLGFGTVKSSALLGAASGGLGSAPWVACALFLATATAVTAALAYRVADRPLPSGPALAVGLIGAVAVRLLGE